MIGLQDESVEVRRALEALPVRESADDEWKRIERALELERLDVLPDPLPEGMESVGDVLPRVIASIPHDSSNA